MDIRKYILPINKGILDIIKYTFLICAICGLLIGIKNYSSINKTINSFKDLLQSEDFNFEISNGELAFNNCEDSGVVNGIEYYINDKYYLSSGSEIKEEKISNVDYILFLKDGIQCNAGIVGMNDYLDSQKYYTELQGAYLNNENVLEKLPFINIILSIIIIVQAVLFSFFEFLAQTFFMSLVIYFVSKIIKVPRAYKTIFKYTLYAAFLPKILLTVIKLIGLSMEVSPIMLLTGVIYILITYENCD